MEYLPADGAKNVAIPHSVCYNKENAVSGRFGIKNHIFRLLAQKNRWMQCILSQNRICISEHSAKGEQES